MSLKINAQSPFQKDAETIDALIKATYEVVSGEKGEKRQWERDRFLHHPQAIYSFPDPEKNLQIVMSVNDFHAETDSMTLQTAFFETEINREVRVFGNVAQVWSTYETRLEKNGPVKRRGINSIQLFYNENRWYILSWAFDRETDRNKIPKSFDRN
jgi:hypothetical protein